METLSTNALLGRLNWRYATKKFDPAKPIHPSVWAALEEALVLSPSSYGLQPYRFVVVSDLELRKKLRAVSWDQPQVTDASHFVVLAHKLAITEEDVESFVTLIAETRLAARDSLQSYYDMMMGDLVKGPQSASIREWAACQTHIALGNLLASAALLGVDACPMGGLDHAKYDEILGLTAKGYGTTVACALGYRAADDKYASLKKVRFPSDELIEHR
jgi:nitroreductase